MNLLTIVMLSEEQKNGLLNEISFKTSRSGGSGGQHVNKVSSKVELIFNVSTSLALVDAQRSLLQQVLATKLDGSGCLHVVAQKDRSQLVNKQLALEKFFSLIQASLIVKPARKATKTPKSVVLNRLDQKQKMAVKKITRRKVDVRKLD